MYINYGDKNFFEWGCLVEDRSSLNDVEFSIIVCRPYSDEPGYYEYAECTVCPTDSWIENDRESVLSYIGMGEDDFDSIQFAIGCIDYYGAENFGYAYRYTRNEILAELAKFDFDLVSIGVEI